MRCLVLFSGSLESMLATRLMQQQGIEPVGIFFRALCARHEPPLKQAEQLGMRLTLAGTDAAYYEALRHPTLGRAKNAAACLDCRVQLLRQAMHRLGPETLAEWKAEFLVSGEVLGQRPKSQNRNDLEAVAYHADAEDLLVRPLSAKLLPETRPEREKWIDRERLHALHGNAHKGMIQLARNLGLRDLPASRPACGLADPSLSARVFDHLQHSASNAPAGFTLLTIGRHFRFDATTKVIVGRNQSDNAVLAQVFASDESAAVVKPINFIGPTAAVLGELTAEVESFASALVKRFGRRAGNGAVVELIYNGHRRELPVCDHPQAACAIAIGSA